jgi:hypothetical protein
MSLTQEDREWIVEQLRDMETRILTEFQKWASPVDARIRSHSSVLRALDVEFEALSDRVKKLEAR